MTQPERAPTRTADPRLAFDLVRAGGAAILTGAGSTGDDAVAAARAIFGAKVRAVPEAAEVRSGGVRDVATRRPSPDEALGAHTDGFAYGDDYPDYFLLLCARDAAVGGDSFLVDGYGLLDGVAATGDEGAVLVERLHSVPVDQTESGMHRSVSPLVGRAPGGRRMVRRFPFQRPSDDSTDPASDAALVAAWDRLCRDGADRATRFHLAPGEVAVIDNYRMLHGREPYVDPERLMWRVWVWTDEAKGVPAGTLASDSRNANVVPASAEWPTITGEATSVIPVSASTPAAAAGLLGAHGAAVLPNVGSEEAALAAARAVLGERAVHVTLQFQATTAGHLASQAKLLAGATPDRRGRVRRFTPPEEVMVPHNDGYGFGDLAPDHLFLWCETPDPSGGASWLIDGPGLLGALDADPGTAGLAAFCRDRPIDHTEPGFVSFPPAPIARTLESGRLQVRFNPYLSPVGAPGSSDTEATDEAMIERWGAAVLSARSRARRFQLRAGEMLCIDNYALLHGRDAYFDPSRRLVAIWGWSRDAVAVPTEALHLV